MTDTAKMGARNNTEDKRRIGEIRNCAKTILQHADDMEPEAENITAENVMKPVKGDDMPVDMFPLTTMFTDISVKMAGDWELDVLAVPFGGPKNGRDLDGQYFSKSTNLFRENYPTPLIVYYHGRTPDGKPMGEPEIIGKPTKSWTTDEGVWFRVLLDKTSQYAKRVWESAKAKLARASSGSISHLVRVAKDGLIKLWPLVEISLIDSDGKRQPSNAYAVALPVMKSHFEKAGAVAPDIAPQPEPEDDGQTAPVEGEGTKTDKTLEDKEMETEETKKLIAEAIKADREVREAEAKAAAEKQSAIESAVKAEKEKWEAEAAKSRRLPLGMPLVTKFEDTYKYDGMSTSELALMVDTMKSANKEVSPSAIKALMLRVARIENDHVSPETASYAKSALKSVLNCELSDEAIKAATDPMYTGGSNIGSDWVGTAYSNQLWEAVRAKAQVAQKIPSAVIPDGYSSEYWPLESTDPTWYKVAEASTSGSAVNYVPDYKITPSQVATDKKQITVAKMGCRVMYSGEMVEDSLIPFISQLRQQMEMSGAEQMEHVIIDGDTATSSNINDIGGTTYSGSATTLFLLTNGFRKVGITNGRSAAGSLSEDDYLDTAKKLGLNGIGADPGRCSFIVDPNTYFKTLKLATLKTKDVFTQATLEGGTLTRMWNYPVMASWFMHWRQTSRLANTAGKVDLDTAGNNLYGGILAVRWDQWKLAYKRRMTMETTRFANADAWEIVALTRWGLGYRDSYASAETYYVGV